MEKQWLCGACDMMFRSTGLLEKHTALLCIGGQVRGGGRVGGGGVDAEQTRTPELAQTRGQRRNAAGRRSSADDPLEYGSTEDQPARGRTDGAALQNLTDEFHRLRMSFEENLPNWTRRTTDAEPVRSQTSTVVHAELSQRHLGHGERRKEMREMARTHAHNLQLEQERGELAHQVGVPCDQSNASHLESLLMELREQEERTEETLQQLAEHLRASHVQKVSLPADRPDPASSKKMHHDKCKLTAPVDGPLSTQIKALRQAYTQSGGSDPAVVAQMIDLQADAQSLEKNEAVAATSAHATRKEGEPPPQRQGPSRELLLLEQENQRLEEEILRIQLARERNLHRDGWTVEPHVSNTSMAAAVRTELELNQGVILQQVDPRPCRHPPPSPPPLQTKTHIHAPLSLLHIRSFSSSSGGHVTVPLESLGPAPYDPTAGFVVFFDLVLGADASQKALRLVAALYSEGVEVGPPTPLPPVQCLPGVSSPYAHSLISLTHGNYAPLSVKLLVPGMQPSPSLCLVVEVQAATDLDVHEQDVFRMVSSGWARLELFDRHNQLRSGHWRAPVRSLPIKPPLSIAELNSTPQVGNMELCVRLVNGRDEDVQTLEQPELTSTRHYRYPAVASSPRATVHGNAAPQSRGSHQLPLPRLSSTDHRNPPATE